MFKIFTAMITPLINDRINDVEFINIINEQLINNCIPILFGSTGEGNLLSLEEKSNFLSNLECKDRVFIGIGGYNIMEIYDQLNIYVSLGYEKFMISAPPYSRPIQEGLYQYFNRIFSSFRNQKFLLYNIPSRTAVDILPETGLRILRENNNVIGIKEASGRLNYLIEYINYRDNERNDFLVMSGNDNELKDAINLNANGIVSVASNICPQYIHYLISSPNNDYQYFTQLIDLLFIESNPTPTKFIMFKLNKISNYDVILPLVSLSISSQNTISNYLLNNQSNLYL